MSIVVVLLIGVFAYHSMFSRDQAATKKSYQVPGLNSDVVKSDGASLSKTAGSSGTQPSSLSTTTDMLKELTAVLEDGDTTDFSSIEQQLSQL